MNCNLNEEVLNTLEKGRKIGEAFIHYSFPAGPNKDKIAVISNKRTSKAGMLFYNESDGDITYYLISFSKWDWYETEGFTSAEIIKKLGKDVFLRVNEKEFPYMLSTCGDP
tara:strand:- start:36 stop:368 length:333 start_codon:yes stop_codon:yes gene_type:complete